MNKMTQEYKMHIKNHIKTHTERSDEDIKAVSSVTYYLTNLCNKIKPNFTANDKWPNHDGTFEFVPNPDCSRQPEQIFSVQIKGTLENYEEKNGNIEYRLSQLAFPAFIACEVTADPGILFVVLRDQDPVRIFWKYLSPSVIKNIDFEKNSTVIIFYPQEEILNTKESLDNFCDELTKIVKTHSFLNRLDIDELSKEEAIKIIKKRCTEVSEVIENKTALSRDVVSDKIITWFQDICYSALVLNAYSAGYSNVNERLAWEIARLNIDSKYLSDFMLGIKYKGIRIPEDGQSERLMLKYYNYLWEIRSFLKNKYKLSVLKNLESFPLDTDILDQEYYETVVQSIKQLNTSPTNTTTTRYYIQKKTAFYVDGEKYYEITLQMASKYATKFNRIIVYTKLEISTAYSIQIGYTDTQICFWGISSTVRIVNNWKVSINPKCLNMLGVVISNHYPIKKTHREYTSLMNFLTKTGMDLLDLINLEDCLFEDSIKEIYSNTNTNNFKNVLMVLHNKYSIGKNTWGKHTIRYLLLYLREDIFMKVLPYNKESKLGDALYLSKKCFPFENNPYISNLVGRRTSKGITDILRITSEIYKEKEVNPYWSVESLVRKTGEIYIEKSLITSFDEIENYNKKLDEWEVKNGYKINKIDNYVYIESYEKHIISILSRLLKLSKIPNNGQQALNKKYISKCHIDFLDINQKQALEKAFVSSRIMLIYGAAGTGKTTLMNYISNMLSKDKKLFLTKTHTALYNLKRRIENPGITDDFICIDRFVKSKDDFDYNTVFIDECSTIDNRTMNEFLKKIKDDTFIVMVGDIYQIESIDFGNWFYYAKDIINADGANIDLIKNHRTKNEKLKRLWDEVRNKEPMIIEKLAIDGPFSEDIGPDLFSYNENEVVLCLNYDGKFGLNNINNFFQNNNPNKTVFSWAEWTFKIGDPIIFMDTKRSELLYNNLKGKIVDITIEKSKITFILDIDVILTEIQCQREKFKFVNSLENEEKTRIELDVISEDDELSEDEQILTIIPFQIAYAVSIHKAQGLEYDSVKVVIPSNNSNKITHSIFYTAITRARNKLKIYWSAETMNKVIEGFFNEKKDDNTLNLLKNRLSEI